MIGLVLVTYACWPGRLIEGLEAYAEPLLWSIHHHGSDAVFAKRIESLGCRPNVRLHMHCSNRGLSRSWNEGLKELYDSGARMVLLVNDDLHFVPGGLDRFMEFTRNTGDFGLAFTLGLELPGSPLAGQIRSQDFACCVIPASTIAKIGYFDQNIMPAYYEDLDYSRRCFLAGLRAVVADVVNVEHDRSFAARSDVEIGEKVSRAIEKNCKYYTRKWGPPGEEKFDRPFNKDELSLCITWEMRSNPYQHEDLSP